VSFAKLSAMFHTWRNGERAQTLTEHE
jgi:hypothetical protein